MKEISQLPDIGARRAAPDLCSLGEYFPRAEVRGSRIRRGDICQGIGGSRGCPRLGGPSELCAHVLMVEFPSTPDATRLSPFVAVCQQRGVMFTSKCPVPPVTMQQQLHAHPCLGVCARCIRARAFDTASSVITTGSQASFTEALLGK